MTQYVLYITSGRGRIFEELLDASKIHPTTLEYMKNKAIDDYITEGSKDEYQKVEGENKWVHKQYPSRISDYEPLDMKECRVPWNEGYLVNGKIVAVIKYWYD